MPDQKKISWHIYGGAYNDAVVLSNEALRQIRQPQLGAAALTDRLMPSAFATPDLQSVPVCQVDHGRSGGSDAAYQGYADLITAIKNKHSACGVVRKADVLLDGHPQSSKVDLLEAYLLNVLGASTTNPSSRPRRPSSSPL